MSYKNTYFQGIALVMLFLFLANILVPNFQSRYFENTFAAPTQYYVDATTGDDNNNGTSDVTPWASVAKINAEALSGTILPGDTIYFRCGDSWGGEDLTIITNSITFDGYQAPSGWTCGYGTRPIIRSITANGVSGVNVNGLDVRASNAGSALDFANASNITFYNNAFSNTVGSCLSFITGTGLLLDSNTFSSCTYAFSGANIAGTFSNNTFSGMTENALSIVSSSAVTVNNNIFSNLQKGAIVFGQATTVSQNDISSVCQGSGTGCSAIRNDEYSPGASYASASVSENIIKNVGSGIIMGNYGISLLNIDGATVTQNTVNNAEEAIHIEDAKNLTIAGNVFALSRARGVHVIQNISASVSNNHFDGNSLLEKNPDFPYIEMYDATSTGSLPTMLTPSSTQFYPLYKPNTSYIRSVKYGGNTVEYARKDLLTFDPTLQKIELYGYKPYTNTGSPTGGELVGNGSFGTDVSGWTAGADIGLAPTLSHNPTGSYIDGSLQVTPTGGSPDRIWATANIGASLISGRNYRVTGYLKSGSGNINIRAFLHSSSDKHILYSDRIAETYASASGRTFSLYLQSNTGASDAQITFESSNPDVSYELDEVSVVRLSTLTKNNTANEVQILSNTGSSPLSQNCPGGTCGSYIDITTIPSSWPTLVSWPITIPAYRTSIVTLSGGANMIYPPTINSFVPTSGGSVDAGSPATVAWDIAGGNYNTLEFPTYYNTGGITSVVPLSGNTGFILPYDPDLSYNSVLSSENDAGISTATITFSVNNIPPFTFVSTMTGTEDDSIIVGTLSGYDILPGDFNLFAIDTFPSPTLGTLSLVNANSGTIQFVPEPNVCGIVNFDFSASDKRFQSSSPLTQPINITCVNDAPVFLSNKTASGYAGITFPIDIVENTNFEDVDSPYQTQVFHMNFTQPANGVVTSSGTQFQYTANPAFSGADSFQFSVSDQSGGTTATGTVNVTITRFNNPPIVTATGYTINEDTVLSSSLTGSDADGDVLSYTATTLPLHGIVSVLAGGNFTYTPTANYNGSDSFVFGASDGMITSTGIVTVTIDPVPDAPVANNDNISPLQDTSVFIPVMANDTDVDSVVLTLTGYTNPSHGVIIVTGTGFTYTPTSGYVGSDSFTYRLEDDTALLSNTATVSINVTSSNSAPISNDISVSTNEDTVLISTLSGSDPDLDTLTYILDTSVSNGTLSVSATGGFRYTPNLNYNGSDTFTYHVSDGVLTSTASTVTITVFPVNDTPTATPTTYSVSSNTPSSSGNTFTGVLSGTDIETSLLSFTASTQPVHGTLTLTSTGYFTYTPALGYVGSDSFIFMTNDGTINSAPATVTLSVGVVVVPPVYSPPAAGPGGGGGGGSVTPNPTVTSTTTIPTTTIPKPDNKTPVKTPTTDVPAEEDLHSAPENKPFEFVLYDPSGLLSQLLLANRILGATGGIIPITQKTEAEKIVSETFGSIVDSILEDFEGPFVLRNLLQIFVLRADQATDTVDVYDTAINSVETWQFTPDSRLEKTQKYILRILERNRKHYEQIIYRDMFNGFNSELDSATEAITNTPNLN